MKAFPSSLMILFPALVAVTGCSKETKTKADSTAAAAQDTMLMKDLAEANRNTAAASAADNSLNTVRTGPDSLSSATPQNRPADGSVLPRPTAPSTLTTTPRLTPPTRASDAPGPTTIPVSRSPASSLSTRTPKDPCDSPSLTDQRYCLNRSIVANDAELNHTYQALIDQAHKSGGSDLEERFRQSQRDWINQRDSDCTAQAASEDGKLWARARARCFASYSTKRTAELNRSLNSLRGQ